MRKYLIVLLIGLTISVCTTPETVVSADASSAWNQHAAIFKFDGYPGSSGLGPTFGDHYNGSNFSADFEGILNTVASTMGTGTPPWGETDPFSWVGTNWPDS